MSTRLKILLTDDNEEFALNVKDILETKGYEVLVANSGFSALKIISRSPVDLVLMDIKMPVMNGVEAFKKIKEITPLTPVIMLTAFALEELIQESLQNGAFACLRKPLDFDELFATIEKALPSGSMILLVDDDETLCDNLRGILTQHGYHVSVAYDSNSAIEQVKKAAFNIMLLDIKLPPLNGLETYLAIRKIRSDLVVIIITGNLTEMKDLVTAALNRNAYALLEKPVDIEYLISLLAQIEKEKGILQKK